MLSASLNAVNNLMDRTVEPILSCLCEERDASVIRYVWPMTLTIENLREFYSRAKQYPTLFGEQIDGSFERFLTFVARQPAPGIIEPTGLYYVVDDFVGMFYMTHINPGVEAKVHYSFFDRKHTGREKLTREVIKYAFIKFGFRRLSAEVPLYAKRNSLLFIERVGFKKEGRKRKAALYKNEFFDINCYGLLKEEVLDGV